MSLFEAVDNVFKKDSILTKDSPVAFDKYAKLSRLHEDDGFLSDEAHKLADIIGNMKYSGDYYSVDEWIGCPSDKPNDIYKYHEDLERPLVKDFLAKYKDKVLANWNDFFQAMENDNRHTALHLIAKELGKEESEELTEDDGFLSDEAHKLADIIGNMKYSGDYYSVDEWIGCPSDKPNDIYKYHEDLERPLVKDFLAKYKDKVLANWNDFFQAMENDNRHTALHLIAKELGKEESEELTEDLDIEDMKTKTMQSIDNFLGTVINEVESDVFVQYVNSIIDLAKSYLPNKSEK